MLIELNALPLEIQEQITQGQVLQISLKDGQAYLTPIAKPRVAGRLAHLAPIDNDALLAPMDADELAIWQGELTDEYGISR